MILKSDKLVVVADSGWKHFAGRNDDDGLGTEERGVEPTMLCGPRPIKELTEERMAALCEFIHNLENVC